MKDDSNLELHRRHPNLSIRESDRRIERGRFMHGEYKERLRQAAERRSYVTIEAKIPLWHPTIRWVSGRLSMFSDMFLHLDVYDAKQARLVPRGVSWDHVERLEITSGVPSAAQLRRWGAPQCHGILMTPRSNRRYVKDKPDNVGQSPPA